jgi:hypothetical protein
MTRGLMTLTSDTLEMHEDAQGGQYGTATANKGGESLVQNLMDGAAQELSTRTRHEMITLQDRGIVHPREGGSCR